MYYLAGSVTVIREVLKILKMNVSLLRGVMVMEEVLGGRGVMVIREVFGGMGI